MTRRYVIVGNGIAGQTAAEELRRNDAACSIVIVAAEQYPLYDRGALPGYLRGRVRRERVLLRTPESYAENGIDAHFQTWATEVDAAAHVVRTNAGHELRYDALLIATGGRPKPPPWPGSADIARLYGFQTLDDTDELIERSDQASRLLVLGGGWIACAMAEGVASRGKAKVTWVMRGPWLLHRVLDAEGGRLCHRLGEAAGVELVVNQEVRRLSATGGTFSVETAGGRRQGEFQVLAYAVGLDYYVEPLRGTAAEVRRGIVTDARLRTAAPDVYAAGDVAVFFDRMIGKHNQVGSWASAAAHGVTAAHNMAGGDEEFFDVPTYTTTMFGSTFAVMGITPGMQPNLESVRTFSLDQGFFRKLFFLEGRLVGAIMIGPPAGATKLIEIMRSRMPIEGPREALLDPANLGV